MSSHIMSESCKGIFCKTWIEGIDVRRWHSAGTFSMTPVLRFLLRNRHGNASLLAQQEREMIKKFQSCSNKDVLTTKTLIHKNCEINGYETRLLYQLRPIAWLTDSCAHCFYTSLLSTYVNKTFRMIIRLQWLTFTHAHFWQITF